MLQKAPFTTPAVEITRTEQRYDGFDWSEQPSIALLGEYDDNRHWTRTFIMDVDDPQAEASPALGSYPTDEKYANPGSPFTASSPTACAVIRQDGDAIFLRGLALRPTAIVPSSISSISTP